MTPFTRKLHSALIDIGHQVEGNQHLPAPTIGELKARFDYFKYTVDSGDMISQAHAVKELIWELVRWEMENM